MKIKTIKIVTLIIVLLLLFITFTIMWFSGIPTSTPFQVKNIAINKIPHEFEVESVGSVWKMAEFEGNKYWIKVLVLTLKNNILIDENEFYKIGEPICKEVNKNGFDYAGLDIYPHKTLRTGVNCSTWGP